MSFVSSNFVLFALAFAAIYFLAQSGWRKAILLVGSYIFCAFFSPTFLLVLFVSTASNVGTLALMKRKPGSARQFMIAGIVLNIALLASFKYVGFLLSTFAELASVAGFAVSTRAPAIWVPIGISFYTFQAISLLIDVHRRKLALPKVFDIALLLAFWPKLIAGPIVRGTQLIPQLQSPRRFRWVNLWLGTEAIVYGLALKTMLADYLAPEVDKVFGSPKSYSSIDNLFAAFLYTFQIYGDFAGYSLMAIGFARILGYHLPPNFRRPNFAASFGDFWRRWHLSLSSFLGDYIYRSLPYRGPREWVRSRNMIITMLVSGLWHGPAWTFVAWGGLHGVFLVAGRQLGRLTSPLYVNRPWLAGMTWPFRVLSVFALVALTRIFFRSASFAQAIEVIHRIAAGPWHIGDLQNKLTVAVCLVVIVAVTFCEALVEFGIWRRLKRVRLLRVTWPILVMTVTVLIGEFEGGQFVYVRF